MKKNEQKGGVVKVGAVQGNGPNVHKMRFPRKEETDKD